MAALDRSTRSVDPGDPNYSPELVTFIDNKLREEGALRWCFGAQWKDLSFVGLTLPNSVWVYNDKFDGFATLSSSKRVVRVDFSIVHFPTVRDKYWRMVDFCNHVETQLAGADQVISWLSQCIRLGSDPFELAIRFKKYGDKQARDMVRRAFKLANQTQLLESGSSASQFAMGSFHQKMSEKQRRHSK